MWCAIRWPQTPALFRTLLWNFIFKIVGDMNFQKIENVNFVCRLSPSDFKQQSQCSICQNTMPGPICSVNFSRIGPAVSEIFKFLWDCPFPVAKFSRQSNSLIYKKFNYRKTTEPFSTIFEPQICKLRLLEAIQNWYFECMSFKNCSTD